MTEKIHFERDYAEGSLCQSDVADRRWVFSDFLQCLTGNR